MGTNCSGPVSLHSAGPTPRSPVAKRTLAPRAPCLAKSSHKAYVYSNGKPGSVFPYDMEIVCGTFE